MSHRLGEIVAKYGNVVELKGRGKSKPGTEYSETGMMGDIFELGTLELMNSMIEAIFRNLEVDDVFRFCVEEFEKIGDMIDANVNSETYTRLVDLLEKRTNVFLGGKGTANEIAKMTGVRLFHIKSFLGDNVYITRGVNTPHPRAGDLEILLSYSGETRPVIIWADVIKKFAGTVFAITTSPTQPWQRKLTSKSFCLKKQNPHAKTLLHSGSLRVKSIAC